MVITAVNPYGTHPVETTTNQWVLLLEMLFELLFLCRDHSRIIGLFGGGGVLKTCRTMPESQ